MGFFTRGNLRFSPCDLISFDEIHKYFFIFIKIVKHIVYRRSGRACALVSLKWQILICHHAYKGHRIRNKLIIFIWPYLTLYKVQYHYGHYYIWPYLTLYKVQYHYGHYYIWPYLTLYKVQYHYGHLYMTLLNTI